MQRSRSELREQAKRERVEVPCGICGEPTDISHSYAEKLVNGKRPAPRCLDCKSPTRAAQVNAEAARFVELLGDRARELAVALAALH